jgi:hypothetical protein
MSPIDNLVRMIARELMWQHLHRFPEDMAKAQRDLQERLGVKDGIVFASFQTLEFEIVQAIKEAVAAEREACASLAESMVESVTGLHANDENNIGVDLGDRIAKAIRSRL